MAQRLGVTVATVTRMVRTGRIPAVRLSRKVIRYDPAKVEEALGTNCKPGWKDDADGWCNHLGDNNV
jgi:excisionase family DNA binding protein